jgi:hypothetical protein
MVLSTSSTSSCESSYCSAGTTTTVPPGLKPALACRTGSNGRDSPFPLGSGSPGAAAPGVAPGYDSETDLEEEDVQLHPAYLLFSRSAYVATPARCQSERLTRGTTSMSMLTGEVPTLPSGGPIRTRTVQLRNKRQMGMMSRSSTERT